MWHVDCLLTTGENKSEDEIEQVIDNLKESTMKRMFSSVEKLNRSRLLKMLKCGLI
jgi:hypothetical protein